MTTEGEKFMELIINPELLGWLVNRNVPLEVQQMVQQSVGDLDRQELSKPAHTWIPGPPAPLSNAGSLEHLPMPIGP